MIRVDRGGLVAGRVAGGDAGPVPGEAGLTTMADVITARAATAAAPETASATPLARRRLRTLPAISTGGSAGYPYRAPSAWNRLRICSSSSVMVRAFPVSQRDPKPRQAPGCQRLHRPHATTHGFRRLRLAPVQQEPGRQRGALPDR